MIQNLKTENNGWVSRLLRHLGLLLFAEMGLWFFDVEIFYKALQKLC